MSSVKQRLYWDEYMPPKGEMAPFFLAASDLGLCRVAWPSESFERFHSQLIKSFPGYEIERSPDKLAVIKTQLDDYFNEQRQVFDLPLDLRGTPFQVSVWRALTDIPFGQTRSYSDIAAAVGRPQAVRAVGAANGANPVSIVVPCHRVIGRNAALTGFRGGLNMKEQLLRLEGFHAFDASGHERFRF